MRSLLPLLLLGLLVGCRPPGEGAQNASGGAAQGITVRTELASEPAVGPAEVNVYVLRDNAAVSGAEVVVTGDMTHAGMEPVTAPAPEVETGLYRTEGFEFNMAGDWLLTTEVTLPDGTEVTDEVPVTVPGN